MPDDDSRLADQDTEAAYNRAVRSYEEEFASAMAVYEEWRRKEAKMNETTIKLRLQTRTLNLEGTLVGTMVRAKYVTDALVALTKALEDLGFRVDVSERRANEEEGFDESLADA